jgi:hypothetical protein
MGVHASALKDAFEAANRPSPDGAEDYAIAKAAGCGYLALARSGAPTFLIPLAATPSFGVGRSGGGFSLRPASRVTFRFDARQWDQAAAALECTDAALMDTFCVLVLDLVKRLDASRLEVTWSRILVWLDEWQALLGRRGGLNTEQQLGLWGELWLVSRAAHPDRLVEAWRGPEGDAVDFFLDGIGLEVKVSRNAHVHHVSQRQVDLPVGQHAAYLLSLWVAPEPVRGVSLAQLVDSILGAVSDPARFLRDVALLGYSLMDREQYTLRYVALDAPLWFPGDDVPRIRAADSGISHIRYVVALNPDKCVAKETERDLWRHFCQIESPVLITPISPISHP